MTNPKLVHLSAAPPALRCVLSGVLFTLAFPHADLGWLSWVAFIPFLSIFPTKGYVQAGMYGLLFGLVAYTGLLYWIGVFAAHIIGPAPACVGLLLAAVSQAIVVVGFGLGAQWLSQRNSAWSFVLGAPALWTIFEWIRQLGPLGTGWGDIAYCQHNYPIVLMLTRLTGVWGLGWLIFAVNAGILYLFRGDRRWGLHAVWAIPLAGSLIYGALTVRPDPNSLGSRGYYAAALQPNISEDVPWNGGRPADPRYVQRVMNTLNGQMAYARSKGAILCASPETSYPGYPEWDPVLRSQLNGMLAVNQETILLGGDDYVASANQDANSLFCIWPDGRTHGIYNKQQLVPFGEFVPFRKIFPILEALHVTLIDRAAGGPGQPLLDAGPAGKVASAICYESSYGRLTREQIARGANIIVVVTDDTWFGRTAAARQHAAVSAVRAAESDRYVVRSAETGISQVIDPYGRVLAEAGLFVPAVVVAPVEARTTITPYVRYGDWFIAVCFALFVGSAASGRGRRRKSDDSPDH